MSSAVARLESDEQEVRAMSARWLAELQHRDAKRMASYYAEEGVFLVPNAPLAKGRREIADTWAQLLSLPNLDLRWSTREVLTAAGSGMVCEIGTYALRAGTPPGAMFDEGKYVVVWRRANDSWLVIADAFNSSRSLPVSP